MTGKKASTDMIKNDLMQNKKDAEDLSIKLHLAKLSRIQSVRSSRLRPKTSTILSPRVTRIDTDNSSNMQLVSVN